MDKKLVGKSLKNVISRLIDEGRLRLTVHAKLRMEQRRITLEEISSALKSGSIQESHCSFDVKRQNWRYTILSRIFQGEKNRLGQTNY